MRKNNSKSIRVSDKVMNYILSYPGNGFNEKFENIILYAMESEAERTEELKRLDDIIRDKKNKYYALCDKLRTLEPLVQAALHVNSRVRELDEQLKDCINS
ncbi:MAG: hypothetical protein IJ379_10910 [Lachnospiraceae bacterium]|nr:hypothetical protein [Lachnospiraceae bacterium]